MEYRVITDSGLATLEAKITNYLERGWRLHGSLAVAYSNLKDETRFYQPIVRG